MRRRIHRRLPHVKSVRRPNQKTKRAVVRAPCQPTRRLGTCPCCQPQRFPSRSCTWCTTRRSSRRCSTTRASPTSGTSSRTSASSAAGSCATKPVRSAGPVACACGCTARVRAARLRAFRCLICAGEPEVLKAGECYDMCISRCFCDMCEQPLAADAIIFHCARHDRHPSRCAPVCCRGGGESKERGRRGNVTRRVGWRGAQIPDV